MPASKVDTYEESLSRIFSVISDAKQVADANLPFLIQLETSVLEEIRSPERKMQASGLLPQGGPPQGGGGGGMGMSAPPPSFLGAGAPPGVSMSPGGPANADEMRRVMTAPGT